MKYPAAYNRDFNWYLSMRHTFDFDGALDYVNKQGKDIVRYCKGGVDAKKAFFMWDSMGQIVCTRHPNLLRTLLKTKGSVNLHIKAYAEDRAKGVLPKIMFEDICQEVKAPEWFAKAVEQQKWKFF